MTTERALGADVVHRFEVRPERVYAVLVDAAAYPRWLIGAQEVRGVEDGWPAPGSGFHHVVGVGPFRVKGRTAVLAAEPPWCVALEAGVGWLGSLQVEFVLRDERTSTVLGVTERARSGLVRHVWRLGGAPLMRRLLWGRNHLSLQQLADELGVDGRSMPADQLAASAAAGGGARPSTD
jgi:uncharacterized protein YndB with AHSA1/START domain